MKLVKTLILCLIGTMALGQKSYNDLIWIVENDRFGFIDSTGRVVVHPGYVSAGEFSEGLAPVRANGEYGYIDSKGLMVIQEAFDFASPFVNGYAIVYKDGIPFYIDRNGNRLFKSAFPEIGNYRNGFACVKTVSGKIGLVNTKGDLVLDTVFKSVQYAGDHLQYIVIGENHDPHPDSDKPRVLEVGVINSKGQFIIKYGLYESIHKCGENFQGVVPSPQDDREGYKGRTDILDSNGNILFSINDNRSRFVTGNYSAGLFRVLVSPDTAQENGDDYYAFLNDKGEYVLNNPNYTYLDDFVDGRIIGRDENWQYAIFDNSGRKLPIEGINAIREDQFSNGMALISVNNKWGLIDTSGHFLITPSDSIEYVEVVEDFVAFQRIQPAKGIAEIDTAEVLAPVEIIKSGDDEEIDVIETIVERPVYGLCDLSGKVIIDTLLDEFDRGGFNHGLLKCIIHGKLSYINRQGKLVWQAVQTAKEGLSDLNIDFMNRGYFYAHSAPSKKDVGGFGRSFNDAKIRVDSLFEADKLSIVIKESEVDTFAQSFNGFSIYLVNNTKKLVGFSAQDSRLYMKLQALDSKGEWRDIEYLPSSWCGNSYHMLSLNKGESWKFVVPKYAGSFQTRFRIQLSNIYSDPKKGRREQKFKTIYSNEFAGSINPAQFWRKQDYYPSGLMDPYFD